MLETLRSWLAEGTTIVAQLVATLIFTWVLGWLSALFAEAIEQHVIASLLRGAMYLTMIITVCNWMKGVLSV